MEEKIIFPPRSPTMASSLQRRFEKHLDAIEAALKAGWSYNEVVAHLNANGFIIKAGSFQTMLQRARQKRGAGRTGAQHTVAPGAATSKPELQSGRLPMPAVKPAGLPAKLDWDPHKDPDW